MASKEDCVRLGGLIVGLSDSYGAERGVALREAGQTLVSGKSTKGVTDVLTQALGWSRMPNPQIAGALVELTGREPSLSAVEKAAKAKAANEARAAKAAAKASDDADEAAAKADAAS